MRHITSYLVSNNKAADIFFSLQTDATTKETFFFGDDVTTYQSSIEFLFFSVCLQIDRTSVEVSFVPVGRSVVRSTAARDSCILPNEPSIKRHKTTVHTLAAIFVS